MQDLLVLYDYGIDGDKDNAANKIADGYGAKHIGSGVFLPTGERDIQYRFDHSKIGSAEAAFLAHGFRVKRLGETLQ